MRGVGTALAVALTGLAAQCMRPRVGHAHGVSRQQFHTENAKAFAKCVAEGTAGEIEIVVHGGGSLFKGNEIKRAVQTGQAPIGERLLSAHQNENALFGFDSIPFLATGYEASDKLWDAARPAIEEVLDEQNLVLLYAVPWPPQGSTPRRSWTAPMTWPASSSARTTARPRAWPS